MVDVMPSPPSVGSPGYQGGADTSIDAPTRKSQKRQSSSSSAGGHGGSQSAKQDGSGSFPTQSGPPYTCPTCQTNYSRLEYLRRHERRHADIRPFVCDCGKGFSRSDVLSRHKRQCAVHLNGGVDESGAVEDSSLKAATVGRKSSTSRSKKQKTGRKSQGDAYQDQNGMAGKPAGDEGRTGVAGGGDFAQSPSNMMPGSSFPFQQPGIPSAPPPLLPPAPYANDMNNEFARVNQLNASSFGAISHHLSALSNFNQQHNYPSSPESNGTVSQQNSPRFSAREMSRHGSGGSRFSLRKGGSLDHMGNRGGGSNGLSNPASQYPQEFWEALDPAAKQASSIVSNDYVSQPPTTHPSLSLSAEANATNALANASNAASSGLSNMPGGVTTPRGEPQRFSVPSGPLSPFSSIALTSSMSPYLSAFSNARDTPFVASPSRGGIPGTPGSNLNIFDWTMRPPSKPASSSNPPKRDSLSMQSTNSSGGGPASKTKREEEESANRSDDALLNADADERSAAALLDSLRNAGSRQPPPVSTSGGQNEAGIGSGSSSSNAAATSSSAPVAASTAVAPAKDNDTAPANSSTAQSLESFFDQRNVTVGPETFLLRLQGGAQEERQSTVGPKGVTVPPTELNVVGQNPVDSGGFSLAQYGSSNPNPTFSWDSILFGGNGAVPASEAQPPLSSTSSMGWLMSPGVQQIINTYAGSNVSMPGENGNYFSGGPSPSLTAAITATENASEGMALQVNTLALEKALSDVKNPFYIPPHLFRACYSVNHWALPPLSRLSMLALHSQQNLLKHFPILHEPTFRLDTTPGCLAFAMTMLGCHQHGRMWWTGEEVVQRNNVVSISVGFAEGQEATDTKSKVATVPRNDLDRTENLLQQLDNHKDLTATRFDEEDGQELVRPVVMTEKTDMLMRSFASRAKTEKDKVSVVQALTLFQANQLLSTDAATRSVAAINHSSLVTLAKKAGMFDANAEHCRRKVSYTGDDVLRSTLFESNDLCFSYSFLPTYLPGCSDEEKIWRRWCELGGRRRTTHLIFLMDLIASLDAGIDTRVGINDIAHLPLPTPDTIWRAPTAEAWKKNLEAYLGPSLDEALAELMQGKKATSGASIYGRHGPFARVVMVSALLHGIVHLVEDRMKKVSRPSPLLPWWREEKTPAGRGQDDDDVAMYKSALKRWRDAWDEDDLCLAASASVLQPEKAAQLTKQEADISWLGNYHLFASKTASGAVPLCDDALPLYWLAVVLLGKAMMHSSVKKQSSPDESDTKDMLQNVSQMAESYKTSINKDDEDRIRVASSNGSNSSQHDQSTDYRAVLRFAKAFVSGGEKVHLPLPST